MTKAASSPTKSRPAVNIFAEHAPILWEHGLAPVPLNGKKSCISGFNKWRGPPSRTAIAKLAIQFPDANVGIHLGVSGLIVVDNDDLAQDDEIEELCGATPLTVRSNRGRHRYYREVAENLPTKLLRDSGFSADILQGNHIVTAPPSVHEESGARYVLEGDWSALKDVPPPNTEGLHQLIRTRAKPMRVTAQWINNWLCAEVGDCNDFDALLDVARTMNAGLAAEGCIALDDAKVIRVARNVWRDYEAGKLKRYEGRWDHTLDRANAIIKARCMRTADDTFALLTVLRNMHAPRCRRGETFSITPKSMARDRVIPSWGDNWQRYERARDRLLKLELIRKVRDHVPTGRIPALYILVEI